MKQVLITGGAGFIGRHLTTELLSAGYAVRILDSFVEQVHGGDRGALPDGAECVTGDVRDQDMVERCLTGTDYVVHLAAEVGVGQSMYEIARYVGANDLGTAVLLEALADHPVERLVVASSMSVYGEGLYLAADGSRVANASRSAAQIRRSQWDLVDMDGNLLIPVGTDEEKQVELASIYALTKYVQERSCLIFGASYGIDMIALRLFNVFGPGQALSNPYTGVLANFASRLSNGRPPLIFEDGQQRRDFVHVRDVARAFRLALERPGISGQIINIGSGTAYTIGEVALLIADAMGMAGIAPEITGRARAGDIRNCFANITKATALLDYRPRFRLEDSLPELAAWVGASAAADRSAEMQRELEARGLVS